MFLGFTQRQAFDVSDSDAEHGGVYVFDQAGRYLHTYTDFDSGADRPLGIAFRGNHLFAVDEPAQIQADPDLPGSYLLASWMEGDMIIDFDPDGTIHDSFPFDHSLGVYRLGNGNLLVATDSGIWELDGETGAFVGFERVGSMAMIEQASVKPMVITGPGEGPNNVSDVHGYTVQGQPELEIDAYGIDRFRVNVAVGNPDLDIHPEIISGPGPGVEISIFPGSAIARTPPRTSSRASGDARGSPARGKCPTPARPR